MDRLQITEVRIYHSKSNSRIRAGAQITFNNGLVINDLKVIAGEKGAMWVGMPSRRLPDGEYRDIVYPINAQLREQIRLAVLQQYYKPIFGSVYPIGPDGQPVLPEGLLAQNEGAASGGQAPVAAGASEAGPGAESPGLASGALGSDPAGGAPSHPTTDDVPFAPLAPALAESHEGGPTGSAAEPFAEYEEEAV